MANIYETITDNIVKAIESGAGEFTMPWHSKGLGLAMPHNAKTGDLYKGSNTLSLWIAKDSKGYSTDTWATYKQWSEIGAQVRKDEKATTGIYWSSFDKAVKGENGEDDIERRIFGKAFYVFNADQVEGYQPKDFQPTDDLTKRIEKADSVISATKAIIKNMGARAFYDRIADSITMPDRFRFTGSETSDATQSYYSTLLHELTHWTGATKRFDRTKGKRFGDPDYAFEELVAELGAAFLCAELGIANEPRLDHAQYIENWLKALKNDHRAIFNAASLARQSVEYILKFNQPLAIAA